MDPTIRVLPIQELTPNGWREVYTVISLIPPNPLEHGPPRTQVGTRIFGTFSTREEAEQVARRLRRGSPPYSSFAIKSNPPGSKNNPINDFGESLGMSIPQVAQQATVLDPLAVTGRNPLAEFGGLLPGEEEFTVPFQEERVPLRTRSPGAFRRSRVDETRLAVANSIASEEYARPGIRSERPARNIAEYARRRSAEIASFNERLAIAESLTYQNATERGIERAALTRANTARLKAMAALNRTFSELLGSEALYRATRPTMLLPAPTESSLISRMRMVNPFTRIEIASFGPMGATPAEIARGAASRGLPNVVYPQPVVEGLPIAEQMRILTSNIAREATNIAYRVYPVAEFAPAQARPVYPVAQFAPAQVRPFTTAGRMAASAARSALTGTRIVYRGAVRALPFVQLGLAAYQAVIERDPLGVLFDPLLGGSLNSDNDRRVYELMNQRWRERAEEQEIERLLQPAYTRQYSAGLLPFSFPGAGRARTQAPPQGMSSARPASNPLEYDPELFELFEDFERRRRFDLMFPIQ